jgi:hypothetical protein
MIFVDDAATLRLFGVTTAFAAVIRRRHVQTAVDQDL